MVKFNKIHDQVLHSLKGTGQYELDLINMLFVHGQLRISDTKIHFFKDFYCYDFKC